jgi:hypothetical protein
MHIYLHKVDRANRHTNQYGKESDIPGEVQLLNEQASFRAEYADLQYILFPVLYKVVLSSGMSIGIYKKISGFNSFISSKKSSKPLPLLIQASLTDFNAFTI